MNEFQLLPNPTNIPEAVSTGYQRQNTNVFCLQTGLDTTEPFDNDDGTITIPEGGIVEANGSLFKLLSTVNITKTDQDTANWLAVSDNGDGTANISPVTRPGMWNPAKKGCYLLDGSRTLNWFSFGIPNNLTENTLFFQNVKGIWNIFLQKGWYYIDLRSGLGRGNGGDGYDYGVPGGGGGGIPSLFNVKQQIFFIEKKVPIIIKIGGSGFKGGAAGIPGPYAGGSGGGGSGGGEETIININGLIITAEGVNGGDGGDGGAGNSSYPNYGYNGNGGAGVVGGKAKTGGMGNGYDGPSVTGGVIYDTYGGSSNSTGAAGRSSDGGNGANGSDSNTDTSGGAGGMGSHGRWRADGEPGGYCAIYKLEN
jgi:hypothetical protein